MGGTTSWFKRRPVVASVTVILGLTAGLAAFLWWLVSGVWSTTPWLLSWLAAVSATTFLTYGFDKQRAISGTWRIPERTLFLLAFLGGSLGAFAAMHLFRHKTVKGSFRVAFWLIVALQAALLMWLAKSMWTA